jgi:hypothetical protein
VCAQDDNTTERRGSRNASLNAKKKIGEQLKQDGIAHKQMLADKAATRRLLRKSWAASLSVGGNGSIDADV